MAFPTPGSDAKNLARWAALTPAQRAAEQAYVDRQKQITDDRTGRGRRVGNAVKWGVIGTVAGAAGVGAVGALGAGAGAGAGGASGAAGSGGAAAAGTGGGMTGSTWLGLGQLLTSVFGNVWGAKKQADTAERTTQMQIDANNRAAELEKLAFDDALAYQKEIDARDYSDWLQRDVRDRKDWEAQEQRRAPYRALGDSAIRTLADYIRVPGMRAAQEVPVQQWTPAPYTPGGASSARGGPPTSSTMPVGGRPSIESLYGDFTAGYAAGVPTNHATSEAFVGSFADYAKPYGYNVALNPGHNRARADAYDGMTITGPDGRPVNVDYILNAGGDPAAHGFAFQAENAGGGGAAGGAAGGRRRNTAPESTLLAKYSRRRPSTLAGFMTA